MGGPVCFPYRLCRQVADGGPDGGPDGGLGGVRDRSHANSRDPESDPCMAQAWRVLATRAMLSHAIVPRMFHECSTNVPRMFHECSTNVPRMFHAGVRSLLVLTGARMQGRGGVCGDAGIAVVPHPLAKDSFWEAYAPKQCALMQATGSPKAPYLLT